MMGLVSVKSVSVSESLSWILCSWSWCSTRFVNTDLIHLNLLFINSNFFKWNLNASMSSLHYEKKVFTVRTAALISVRNSMNDLTKKLTDSNKNYNYYFVFYFLPRPPGTKVRVVSTYWLFFLLLLSSDCCVLSWYQGGWLIFIVSVQPHPCSSEHVSCYG